MIMRVLEGDAGADLPPIDPEVIPADGYVGSDACRSCHEREHTAWHASYHRSMTQLASPASVLAPFDGTELALEGVTWRLSRRGDTFWVNGRERHPETGEIVQLERRIVMTTGSHNYQMYWMESAGSGMAPFPLVYLLYDRVWIPRKSRFLAPPAERTPIETGRWSVHCIKCHATHGQPRHGPLEETRVAELGISCEMCHGPGQEHVRRHGSLFRRLGLSRDGGPDSTIANPERLPHDRSAEVCGQCHSIEVFLTREDAFDWQHEGSRYRPGDRLEEFQTIVSGRLEENPPEVREYLDQHPIFRLQNCFWSDGVLRVTGRELHGLKETPCYQRGELSCISCHRLHRADRDDRSLEEWADDQLRRDMRGNEACTQCHSRYRDPGVLAAHTHHPLDSSGSACQNCHMPYTTWGLLRAIRSHTVESPSVRTSLETGRPNACNQCHLDRTMRWAAETLHDWYGTEIPEMSDDEGTVAASILWALSGDAVQRALMAWSMGWEPAREVSGAQWMVPFLCTLLVDPYDAVRFSAQRSLRGYPEYRGLTADSLRAASKERQSAMMSAVLTDWSNGLPASAGRVGSQLLLLADGRMNLEKLRSLAALRNDRDLVLFE